MRENAVNKTKKYTAPVVRTFASCTVLVISAIALVTPAQGGTIVTRLGQAGPGYWAIVSGTRADDLKLDKAGTTIGNVLYAGTDKVDINTSENFAYAINGTLFLAAGATVNNITPVRGGIVRDYTGGAAAWADALAASSYFSGLTPTAKVTGNKIENTMTLTSTGKMNVLNLSKLDLDKQVLTINGSKSDQFVINVNGNFALKQSSILLMGGISASDVIFNVTGGTIKTDKTDTGSLINGILLAPNHDIQLKTTQINGMLLGGKQIELKYGSYVNQAFPPSASEVPEASTVLLLSSGLAGMIWMARKRKASAGAAA